MIGGNRGYQRLGPGALFFAFQLLAIQRLGLHPGLLLICGPCKSSSSHFKGIGSAASTFARHSPNPTPSPAYPTKITSSPSSRNVLF